MEQYVYILSNPAMPGLVKVGKTTSNAQTRAGELFTTGVPEKFVVEFCAEVRDCSRAESAAHAAMKGYRVLPNREFFRLPAVEAIPIAARVIGQHRVVVDRPGVAAEQRSVELARLKEEDSRRREAALNRRQVLESLTREIDEELARDERRRVELVRSLEALRNQYRMRGLRPKKAKTGLRDVFSGRAMEYEKAFSERVAAWDRLEAELAEAGARLTQFSRDAEGRRRTRLTERALLAGERQRLLAESGKRL